MSPPIAVDVPDQLQVVPFGSLNIIREIGAGTFAYVYKARHAELGFVALKVLMPKYATQTLQLKLFMREAALLARIRHSNIVECYGLCKIPAGCSAGGMKAPVETWGMILEYCEGGTMSQRLIQQMTQPHSRVYSMMDALNWMIDIASALHFLQSQAPVILHRDMKQENILLSKNSSGRVVAKLVDFGLQKAVDHSLSTMVRSRDVSQSSVAGESGAYKSGGSNSQLQLGRGAEVGQLFFPIAPGSQVMRKSLQPSRLGMQSNPGSQEVVMAQQQQQQQQNGRGVAANGTAPDVGAAVTNGDSLSRSVTPSECPANMDVAQNGHPSGNRAHHVPEPSVTEEAINVLLETDKLRPEHDWQHVFSLTGETGSPMYMAPEVTSVLPYNEKVDIFSFGVIMYEVFTWSLIRFTHIGAMRTDLPRMQNIEEYATAVAKGYRPERAPMLSDRLWNLIQASWNADPCARPNPAAIVATLEAERQAKTLSPASNNATGCQCVVS